MSKIFYPAIFHPEDVGYSVFLPDFDGCGTQGDDMNEAVTMAQEVIGLMMEESSKDGNAFVTPSVPDSIQHDPGDFVVMVEFDELEYRKLHQSQAVKKTLSIPEWLNTMAVNAGVNFSQVLQEALKQRLGVADR